MAAVIDFTTERGAKARDYVSFLAHHPDARIRNDGVGSVIPIPSAGGALRVKLSVYETGGMFHAMNNPAKTPAECLAHAKEQKAREGAARASA